MIWYLAAITAGNAGFAVCLVDDQNSRTRSALLEAAWASVHG